MSDNIKFFFAGAEQVAFSRLGKALGVNYGLWTCYNHLAKLKGYKYFSQIPKMDDSVAIHTVPTLFKKSIMDSGIFTLMSGAAAGKKTEEFIYEWYDALCEFVISNKIPSTIVEVDCQRVTNPRQAWKLRERMVNDLPSHEIINVWHIEDGKKGLDRIIEFSTYIALPVSELKEIYGSSAKTITSTYTQYIKSKKPTIKIHLLGCSDLSILRYNRYCTSADSTSYQGLYRFGRLKYNKVSDISRQYFNKYRQVAESTLRPHYPDIKEKLLDYYATVCCAMDYHRRLYEATLGNQD